MLALLSYYTVCAKTLGGHKEAVGGVTWTSDSEIVSASWDHTIKVRQWFPLQKGAKVSQLTAY